METTSPCFNIDSQAKYSWRKNPCCDFLWISLYSCIMSYPNRMKPLLGLSITTTPYTTKYDSCIMFAHMLWRRTKLTLKQKILPYPRRNHQALVLPMISCSSYKDIKNLVDSWINQKIKRSSKEVGCQ